MSRRKRFNVVLTLSLIASAALGLQRRRDQGAGGPGGRTEEYGCAGGGLRGYRRNQVANRG
ncbi:hypothetical protein LJK88_23780 [Paenibacillus sp. P26]|nr:hypothetical protein LJK88_23780 [Paenibacillus sp. P26]